MAKLQTNFWEIESFRPGMKIMDSMRNKEVRELLQAWKDGSIRTDDRAITMARKQVAHLSLDYSKEYEDETTVITADENGTFVTDDPIIAFQIVSLLEKAPPLNHPLTKKEVRYELGKRNPPMPSKEEVAKILAEKAKEVNKKAS